MPTIATAHLKSISPYSQTRKIQTPKGPQETFSDHEDRCWRERLHVNENGNVFIPPMAFKNSLCQAAKFLSMKIPGQRTKTYTKVIESGILIIDPLVLPIKAEDVPKVTLFVPSDGVPGGGKRVDKHFPVIQQWEGEVKIHVLNDLISPEVLAEHLWNSGMFVGIGYFRPANRGYWGRFECPSLSVKGKKYTYTPAE